MEFYSTGIHSTEGIERWYAIHTKAREEDRAHGNLDAWGVETFCPKIKHLSTHAFTGRPVRAIKHMFPRYIFAYFDAETMLHKIRFTRGIHSVVTVGRVPAHVDDEIIELLRSRVTPEGFITLQDEFEDGDEVYLKEGPFKGFTGVFNARLKSSDRVTILLTAVNFQGRLIIDKEMVASAGGSRSAEAAPCTKAKAAHNF
jgi:transcriptional antiterminator RfaH